MSPAGRCRRPRQLRQHGSTSCAGRGFGIRPRRCHEPLVAGGRAASSVTPNSTYAGGRCRGGGTTAPSRWCARRHHLIRSRSARPRRPPGWPLRRQAPKHREPHIPAGSAEMSAARTHVQEICSSPCRSPACQTQGTDSSAWQRARACGPGLRARRGRRTPSRYGSSRWACTCSARASGQQPPADSRPGLAHHGEMGSSTDRVHTRRS
jgi:hypothetical protein